MRKVFLVVTIAFAVVSLHARETRAQCPAQDSNSTFNAAAIGALIPSPPQGLTYNSGVPSVELAQHAGNFASNAYSLPGTTIFPWHSPHVAAAVDINGDGWEDIVTASRFNHALKIHLNQTYLQAAPVDWSTTGTIRTPDFLSLPAGATVLNATGQDCSIAIAGGDFDGDGRDDVLTIGCNNGSSLITEVNLHSNDGANSFGAATAAHGTPANLGYIKRSSSAMASTDWNGDGCLDVLTATSSALADGANNQIMALINDCTGNFTEIQLLSGLDFAGTGGSTTNGGGSVVFADFDGDGFLDVVATAASAGTTGVTDSLQLYLSDGAGGFGPKIALTNVVDDAVHAQGLFAVDLDNDNMPDLMWTIDDTTSVAGRDGDVGIWLNDNDGVGHPFETTSPSFTDSGQADLDAGIVLDYDQDPNNTKDIFIVNAIGVLTQPQSLFLVNRHDTAYSECGEVSSNALSTAAIVATEFVVTSAKLSVTETQDGPTGPSYTRYYASNVDPPQWVEATPCAGTTPTYGATATNDYCVRFPSGAGTSVRWRAVLCGDTTGTPDLRDVDVTFDYVAASTQLRAGVVTSNGIGYVGGFASPGDRGKFSAFSIDSTSPATFWEAHTEIDSGNPATRNIYTADRATGNIRIDFVTGAAPGPNTLPETLNVATTAIADSIVAWWDTARFGAAAPLSKLGAVVNSTAAVVTPPGLPVHYSFLGATEQTVVDGFISSTATREDIVLFGSKDGALHAFQTVPDNLADTANGREEWAFIPAPIAKDLERDRRSTGNSLAAFPDGPPSIADIYDGAAYLTLLVQSGGSGSTGTWALDITDTLNNAPSIDGPDPLWHKVVENAGNAYAKPAIIRVDDTSPEGLFQAVIATGLPDGPLPIDTPGVPPVTPHVKGRRVVGVNAATGAELWYFDAVCAVTSDITAFETDDNDAAIGGAAADPNRIDGFVDRIVFGDYCGYVYMLNMSSNPTGLVTGMGTVDTLVLDDGGASTIKALFWTGTTVAGPPSSAPLGNNERRPIAGGIAARPDDSTDMVLFFGTGGLEEYDPTKENMFYAIYAKDGSIRSKLTPGCEVSGMCSKFFGGTVTTATQVIITQTLEPVINNATCDLGTAQFVLADLSDENANGLFDDNQTILTNANAASVGAIFASNNAIYVTTLRGEVKQIGESSVLTPGSDITQASAATDIVKGEYMATSGWRQVLY